MARAHALSLWQRGRVKHPESAMARGQVSKIVADAEKDPFTAGAVLSPPPASYPYPLQRGDTIVQRSPLLATGRGSALRTRRRPLLPSRRSRRPGVND
jgi:hypothetical protein